MVDMFPTTDGREVIIIYRAGERPRTTILSLKNPYQSIFSNITCLFVIIIYFMMSSFERPKLLKLDRKIQNYYIFIPIKRVHINDFN